MNGNFTKLIVALRNTYVDESRDHELDGSGDCGPMIARSWDRTRAKLIKDHGFTPESLETEIKIRGVSKKWMHYNA